MTSQSTAKQVLKDLYEIDADLVKLYGELDDNFLVTTQDGEKRILKIMHEGCDPQRVDLQYRAMAHLADTAGSLILPRVIPTTAGQGYVNVAVDGVLRLVWSLTYCPGTLLEDVPTHTDGLIRSFGRTMAVLDLGLKSFTHPAMKQRNKWELTRAGAVRPFVQHVDGDLTTQVEAVLERFEETIQQKLLHLPHSVIHNDANYGNVLVNENAAGDATVDGIIDFGDMSYQPIICEVAIALAYLAVGKNDPLSACCRFLESYTERCELDADEIAVLYDLMLTRLAVSIAIASERRQADPDDQLGQMDKEPVFAALKTLAGISRRQAEDAFQRASAGTSI
jgi:Ser/Thr protein kinase RdoA (MazF antagonist)